MLSESKNSLLSVVPLAMLLIKRNFSCSKRRGIGKYNVQMLYRNLSWASSLCGINQLQWEFDEGENFTVFPMTYICYNTYRLKGSKNKCTA